MGLSYQLGCIQSGWHRLEMWIVSVPWYNRLCWLILRFYYSPRVWFYLGLWYSPKRVYSIYVCGTLPWHVFHSGSLVHTRNVIINLVPCYFFFLVLSMTTVGTRFWHVFDPTRMIHITSYVSIVRRSTFLSYVFYYSYIVSCAGVGCSSEVFSWLVSIVLVSTLTYFVLKM